jgi:hypothetical protein
LFFADHLKKVTKHGLASRHQYLIRSRISPRFCSDLDSGDMARDSEKPDIRRLKTHVWLVIVALVLWRTVAAAQSPTPQPLLVEGHAHITNRVYWEGIDPWKEQSVGQSYARARAAGVNVLVDNISPYGYERYDLTARQVGRLIETFYRVLEANRDKMELALTAADVRRIVASGKMAVILGIEAGFDQDGDLDILRLWPPAWRKDDSVFQPHYKFIFGRLQYSQW